MLHKRHLGFQFRFRWQSVWILSDGEHGVLEANEFNVLLLILTVLRRAGRCQRQLEDLTSCLHNSDQGRVGDLKTPQRPKRAEDQSHQECRLPKTNLRTQGPINIQDIDMSTRPERHCQKKTRPVQDDQVHRRSTQCVWFIDTTRVWFIDTMRVWSVSIPIKDQIGAKIIEKTYAYTRRSVCLGNLLGRHQREFTKLPGLMSRQRMILIPFFNRTVIKGSLCHFSQQNFIIKTQILI